MALKTYIGINGAACRVKKAYIGVNGKACRIRKAYIGVGGLARPLWFGYLEYYGVLEDKLSLTVNNLAATTAANTKAFFAGGESATRYNDAVDTYSRSLSRQTAPSKLTDARANLAATSISSYALFAGGNVGSGSNIVSLKTVDAYNTGLSKTTPNPLNSARYNLAATTLNNLVLFGGGQTNPDTASSLVDLYNASTTKLSYTNYLSEARHSLAATSIGNYAIFGGGYSISNGSASNKIDVINSSATNVSVSTSLSIARFGLAATSLGDLAFFAGGRIRDNYTDPGRKNIVDIFDASLTRIRSTELSAARYDLAATSIGDYVIFGGGDGGSVGARTVDVFDTSMTRVSTYISLRNFTSNRNGLAATTIGDFALFGGGNYANDVEAYIAP